MFIYNVKINGSFWFRIIMIIMALVVLGIFILSIYNIVFSENGILKISDEMNHSNVTEISPENYTNILKAVHDDLDSYIGKEIKFCGYVYKIFDFEDNQFVLARDMLIDSKSYVVGFLCEYPNSSELEARSVG